jgi:hypothetical protein
MVMRKTVRWLVAVALCLALAWWWLEARAQQQPKPGLPDPNTPAATVLDVQAASAEDLAKALSQYLMAVQSKELPATPETREKLNRILGELFDLRQQVQQQELKALEDRLRSLKEQLGSRAKERDAIIAKQAEAILEGKEPPVPLWVPSTGKVTWPAYGLTKPAVTPKTPSPEPTPMKSSNTPAGQNTLSTPKYVGSELATLPGETIRIGLPDELIGQLIQAKNDADRELIRVALDTRLGLLRAQITEAEKRIQRVTELARTGVVSTTEIEQAMARLEQLKIVYQAHVALAAKIK